MAAQLHERAFAWTPSYSIQGKKKGGRSRLLQSCFADYSGRGFQVWTGHAPDVVLSTLVCFSPSCQ